MSQPSVLVVGAGPVGLSLAIALRRHGVAADLVDLASGHAQESRALGIQARTLEVWGPTLSEKLIAEGRKVGGARLMQGGSTLAHLELSGAPTAYAYMLALSQSRTEALLGQHLLELGGSIAWHTELTTLHDEGDAVAVTLRSPEGEASRRYDWVIGCDGVRSAVRRFAGIGLDQARREHWWILADIELAPGALAENCGWAFLDRGATLLLPLEQPHRWRLIALGPEGDVRPEVTSASVESLLAERCSVPVEVGTQHWHSAFRIREHLADHYQKGRVFLAGDAAHAHSPLGGQGMNTGVQDVYNLAWKLALVLDGAHPSLLRSYEAERRPVGEVLVQATRRGTDIMTASASWLTWLRDHAVARFSKVERFTDLLRRNVEMLSVAYPGSPIVAGPRATHREEAPDLAARMAARRAAAPGERAPLQHAEVRSDDPRHTVWLFDGRARSDGGYARMNEAAALEGERFRVVHVVPDAEAASHIERGDVILDADLRLHQAFGADTEAIVVVRPDGYIGYRSQPIDLDTLSAWWREVTGWPLR